ncbi:Lactate utilization protein C [Thalassoglobus neptunius]|uniref:Lactate utilization protein C n=1 Tax=Thalassoglobus neptunius TaxID=1938619 RepID=A0A5C5X798_9PLAN|nr:LUD domain-containing protein [Thalassoglobus neptunius]TWT58648.1 Lactate utilization protein C [Thalassoglobus neptunius]
MSSREQILTQIRKYLPQSTELPDHQGEWTEYPDPFEEFKTVLEGVGGVCEIVQSVNDIPGRLAELNAAELTVVSCVPDVFEDRFDLNTISDPHDLQDVDWAILPGELAVAENAAIWVTDKNVPHRVLYFLSQYLVLVVPRSQLVNNMHEAYEKIDPSGRAFGTFISGPSKTADIEQSLVKGAHGARTLTVFFVEDLES